MKLRERISDIPARSVSYLVLRDLSSEYFRHKFLESRVDGSEGVDLADWQMSGEREQRT